jgi:lipoyl(octanoyl) transferase
VIVEDLGRMAYAEALAVQETRVEAVAAGAEECLLLVEHPPVVTLGRHGGAEHLLASEAELVRQGVELVTTMRGGQVSCHFPGQLVGYPIVRIRERPGGVRGLVSAIEDLLVEILSTYGITAAGDTSRPGVYVRGRKIAAIGLAIRRMVSYHGFSLNVGPDLSLFSRMVPCGLTGVEVTSMSRELEQDISLNEVKQHVGRCFAARFAPAPLA